jgi:CTP synthase (UTP-ammonia lyase)
MRRSSQVHFVDMVEYEGERYFMVINAEKPELNRIEKVSDERFIDFIEKILDPTIPLSHLEERVAA